MKSPGVELRRAQRDQPDGHMVLRLPKQETETWQEYEQVRPGQLLQGSGDQSLVATCISVRVHVPTVGCECL